MFNFKGLILILSTLFLFGCTEKLEQTEVIYDKEKDATNSNQQSSIEETSTSEEMRERSYEETILEEINFRDDLEIVENVALCEEENVYCFNYNSDIIVKMEMDYAQKEFYELMMDYKLPVGGVLENEGSLYEIVVYENGYKFYTENKMLHYAPYHSTDVVKPTEEQYFGIVIMRVELFGSGRTERIENKEQSQVILKGLNELKEFAQDEIVLTWIEDCSTILQQIVDKENPEKEMYLKALKQLNYLGNVGQIYRYENGNL